MNQLLIAIFGLLALSGAMLTKNPTINRAAPIVGILGQPFWLYETFVSAQWGMFGLSVCYTLIYAVAIAKGVQHEPH